MHSTNPYGALFSCIFKIPHLSSLNQLILEITHPQSRQLSTAGWWFRNVIQQSNVTLPRPRTKSADDTLVGKFAKLGLSAGKAAEATLYLGTASLDNTAGGRNERARRVKSFAKSIHVSTFCRVHFQGPCHL